MNTTENVDIKKKIFSSVFPFDLRKGETKENGLG